MRKHSLQFSIASLTLLMLATLICTLNVAAASDSYQLRLVVEVASASGPSLSVGAKFGSSPTLYRLKADAGRYAIQAETAASGAVIYLMRGGAEVRHDAVRWQGRPGGQTTVVVLYQLDTLGGLRLVGMAQADGILPTLNLNSDAAGGPPATSSDSGDSNTDTVNNPNPDPATAGGANPPGGGDGSDAPSGFVAANPPTGGQAEASPPMPQSPTATLTITITRTPLLTATPTIAQTPTGGVSGKAAGGQSGSSQPGVNGWIVFFGLLLIAAGYFGPQYLKGQTGAAAVDTRQGGPKQ